MCSKGAAGSPGSSSGMQEQLLVSSFGSHDSVCKPDLPPGEHIHPRLTRFIFLKSKVITIHVPGVFMARYVQHNYEWHWKGGL
jgi:hypothetical protein